MSKTQIYLDPADRLSEVNQVLLHQVLAQSELEGSTLNGRRRAAVISVLQTDASTLTFKALAPKAGDGDLWMDISIRYQPKNDLYDALVRHVMEADDGMSLDSRYELIDQLGCDQLPLLIQGEYCNDPDNAMAEPQAEAWLKLSESQKAARRPSSPGMKF